MDKITDSNDIIFTSKDNPKRKRRRSEMFNKRWIGKNANEDSLKRYCFEIWGDLIRTIDGKKCFMCGSKNNLAAHHLITKKWLKTSLDINCGITLCKNCHDNKITSAHISPWIFEKAIRDKRPEQYKWYLINRTNIHEDNQEPLNYKEILSFLLDEFEKIDPSSIKRNHHFKYSENEEKQIIYEYQNSLCSINALAKKWECSSTTIDGIFARHTFQTIPRDPKRNNKPHWEPTVIERLKKLYGHCVVKLDKDKRVIQEYVSMYEASRQNGLSKNSVRNCIKGRTKTAGGYFWIYKKDLPKDTKKNINIK